MQLKDKGIKVYVVIIDFLVDSLEVLRVVSEEGYFFRINFFSGIEEVELKIIYVVM